MKKLIIFHSRDTDGFMSGSLLFNHLNQQNEIISLVGYNREDPEDYRTEENHYHLLYKNFMEFHEIYITDILMNTQWFIDYESYITVNATEDFTQKIHIFDHHKNAVDDLMDTLAILKFDVTQINKTKINFRNNFLDIDIYYSTDSATKIVWDYLKDNFKNLKSLEKDNFINLLSEYDTWQWQTKYVSPNYDALYLEYFLREKYSEEMSEKNIHAYSSILSMFHSYFNKSIILDQFIDFGKNIFDKKLTEIKNNGIVPIIFNNDNFMCVFNDKPDYIMQHNVNQITKTLYPNTIFKGILFISFKEEALTISVRQLDTYFDCNLFCRKLSKDLDETTGGGHFGAAGLKIKKFENINNFMSLITYGIS